MGDRKTIFAIIVVLVMVPLIFMAGYFVSELRIPPPTVKEPAKKEVLFDPKNTTCFLFDMTKAGWILGTENNRDNYSRLVKLKKYDFLEAETTTCYKRYPDKKLGEPTRLRNEWFKKKRFQ